MITRCFLLSPRVVFRARISAGSPLIYPLITLPYNSVSAGSSGAIKAGMTVLVGSSSGGDDKGRQRVRAAASGSLIPIGRSSQGNHDGEVDPEDGDYITVLDDYRVWAKLRKIDNSGSSQVEKKDSDVAASGEVATPRPIANGGPGYAATISPLSGVITHTFDGTNSFQFDPALSGSLTSVASYLWNVKDGTITSGAASDASIIATFPAGFRWVTLRVAADSGKTHTCFIPVFARDPDDDVCIAHQITGHTVTPQGQEIAIRALQDLPRETYPDGTLVMVFQDASDNDFPIDALDKFIDGSRLIFCGWHQSDENQVRSERTGELRESTLHCVDVVGRLKTLPGMSQVVTTTTIPIFATTRTGIGVTSVPVEPLEGAIPNGTTLGFGGFWVTLSSTASFGVNLVPILSLDGALSSGTTLFFGGVPVTLSASASIGDTTLTVLSLTSTILSGATSNRIPGTPGISTATLTTAAAIGDVNLTVSATPHTIVAGSMATYTDPAPTTWDKTVYPNVLYYLWYLLFWHSTALELADLLLGTQTLNNFEFVILSSDEVNLFQQVETMASLVEPDHHFTCNRSGQMMLVVDPNLLYISDRSSSSVITLTDSDWSEISFSDNRPPRVYKLTAYAIVSDKATETALRCQAPGLSEGQGGQSVELTNRYTDGQFTLNYVEGNRYAKLNARHGPVSVSVSNELAQFLIEPATMEWVHVFPDDAIRPFAVLSNRGLVTEMAINYEYGDKGTAITLRITWEEETYGTAAATATPDDSNSGFI